MTKSPTPSTDMNEQKSADEHPILKLQKILHNYTNNKVSTEKTIIDIHTYARSYAAQTIRELIEEQAEDYLEWKNKTMDFSKPAVQAVPLTVLRAKLQELEGEK